jgi:phosphohistidine phosphatase
MPARSPLRLSLVRHAKTEPARPGQEDWDRVLEPRGQRDAPEMARRLKQQSGKPDRILSSPAVRAITTAMIMARELGVSAQKVQQDERLYLASTKDMLAVIRELGERARHLMVVGHNPGITEFADRISSERGLDNMPTCAVYTLQFPITAWSELEWDSGVDAELDYPKRSA